MGRRNLFRTVTSFLFGFLFTLTTTAGAAVSTLSVVDVKEKSYNNRPALAVIFSGAVKSQSRYSGYLKVLDAQKKEVAGDWFLGQNGRILYFPHVEPDSDYRVLVRRGIAGADGAVLANGSEHHLKTRKLEPAFDFASSGSVLVPGVTDGLPIRTVDVPEVDVEFLRVNDEDLRWFVKKWYGKGGTNWRYMLQRISEHAQSVYLARYKTMAERHVRAVTHLPVFETEELKRPGMYIAAMTRPGKFGYSDTKSAFFYVSDIGVQARQYADGLQVTATSLREGKPLADVKLTLYDGDKEPEEHVLTGLDGTAMLDKPDHGGAVLVARKGRHFSVLNLGRPALDLSDFVVDGHAYRDTQAFVFSNRDLFRPGETVDLSVLLRDFDGKPVPNVPLKLTLVKPDGQAHSSETLPAQPGGYFGSQFQIPADAKTGLWRAEARVDPSSPPIGKFEFHVEEFLPERMKLTLSSATEGGIRFGRKWPVSVEGAFLYGAPAAGNMYEGVLNVSRKVHPFEKYRDYYFGDVNDAKKSYRKTLTREKLDDEGKAQIAVEVPEKYGSPMRFSLTVNLFESGGRPVSRTISETYLPADRLVGIRPLYKGEYAKSHSSAKFELVRVDRLGKPAPAKNMEVTLEKEDWDYYWSYHRGNGWQRDASVDRYPVGSWNVATDKAGLAQLRLPVKWGFYRVRVEDPETGAVSSYRFRAGWWHEEGRSSARPDAVNLVLDKEAYRAGDAVKVKIVPPTGGRGIVRVESDRVLWQKWVDVPDKGTTVTIPFDKSWDGRHDLYISTVVYRAGDHNDHVTPNRAVGVVHLPLDRSARQLEPVLSAPEKVAPGESLDIDVSLSNAGAEQVYAVVAAVDSGILNITDFKTPDPAAAMFSRLAYGVDSRDLFDRVIESLEGRKAQRRFGGDADPSEAPDRSRRPDAKVQTVAFTSGKVTLDANGKAKVSFPMPEFNGELRVMAVVFSGNRFGSAEKRVKVRSPVIAEVTIPRFLAFEDRASGTLELHNMSGQAQTLKLGLDAEGPVSVDGLPATVKLANGQRRQLHFKLTAKSGFGVGKVKLNVEGQGVAIKRHWELGVRAPWHGEKRRKHVILDPGATEEVSLEALKGLRPDSREAVLSISTRPPLSVREAVKGLLHYPYGCLEQTTSRAYPFLYVTEEKALLFGIEPKSRKERAKAIESALKRIATMQLSNGGFALWNRSGREEPWLTPYAVNFMLEARELGYSVPSDMLEKGLKRLEHMVRSGVKLRGRYYSSSRDHLRFASRAFAGYVLAKMRRAPLSALRTLYEYDRDDADAGLPLVQLGLALTLQGDVEKGRKAIAEGIGKKRDNHYLSDYGSPIRDTGMMVALLYRHGVDVEGRDELVFSLSKQLVRRHYLSTQERTAVFLATAALAQADGDGVDVAVEFDGKRQEITGGPIRHLRLDDAAPNDSVRVQSRLGEPLYLTLTVTGYGIEPPPPSDSEFSIKRTLYTMDGKPFEGKTVATGDVFIAHVEVRPEHWSENVLVEELLPAGFEVQNLNIGRGEGLDNITIKGINAGKAMRDDMIRHVEYRDDRFVAAAEADRYRTLNLFYLVRAVSPGEFSYPPPMVEDMYDAERTGIGATPGHLTVTSGGQ